VLRGKWRWGTRIARQFHARISCRGPLGLSRRHIQRRSDRLKRDANVEGMWVLAERDQATSELRSDCLSYLSCGEPYCFSVLGEHHVSETVDFLPGDFVE